MVWTNSCRRTSCTVARTERAMIPAGIIARVIAGRIEVAEILGAEFCQVDAGRTDTGSRQCVCRVHREQHHHDHAQPVMRHRDAEHGECSNGPVGRPAGRRNPASSPRPIPTMKLRPMPLTASSAVLPTAGMTSDYRPVAGS